MSQQTLWRARRAPGDEFYTLAADVADMIAAVEAADPGFWHGRRVLAPCDVPGRSAFHTVLRERFGTLGLDRLTATAYSPRWSRPTLFDTEPATPGRYVTIWRRADGTAAGHRHPLAGDGDFRSLEITALAAEHDTIVTNPPFSLLRDFWAFLRATGARFAIVAPLTAFTHPAIFNDIRAGRAKAHPVSTDYKMDFMRPNGEIERVPALWLSNLPGLDPRPLPPLRTLAENEADGVEYPRFDGSEAREVARLSDIPADYDGPLGVPVSYCARHDPSRFDLIRMRYDEHGHPYHIDGRETFNRATIQRRKATP